MTTDEIQKLISKLCNEALPSLETECVIKNEYSGMLATDLFSLNTLLGSMIEQNVVLFLNNHRSLWDDKHKWEEYHFIRDKESFPDVRLVKKNNRNETVLGIELKSWFILSKEGEPSFRFKTASEVCGENDLLCIVPWYLNNAVCGNPVLAKPWVIFAKTAAEAVKKYWSEDRNSSESERNVETPDIAKQPEINARNKTNYKPQKDHSNNFGRLARTGIMSKFVEDTLKTDILGIPADNWRRFLKVHTDSKTLQDIQKNIASIVKIPKSEEFERIIEDLQNYIKVLPKT